MQKYELFINPTTFFAKKHEIHIILCIINGFEPHASEKKWYFCTRYLTKEQNYEKGSTGRQKSLENHHHSKSL